MKIRNGFVSNSSSSSFVFGLPKGKDSVEDIKNLMFFNGVPYYDWSEDLECLISGDDAAAALKEDAEPFTERNIRDDGWWSRPRDPKGPRHMVCDYDCRDFQIEKFVKSYPDHDFFIVEYEDNDSFGSAMEHGDHWDRVPCIRISHH